MARYRGLAWVVVALPACRAVLGLEEPLDRPSPGGSGAGGTDPIVGPASSSSRAGGGADPGTGGDGVGGLGAGGLGAGGEADGVQCGRGGLACPGLCCTYGPGQTCKAAEAKCASGIGNACDEPGDCPNGKCCLKETGIIEGKATCIALDVVCKAPFFLDSGLVCQSNEDCESLGKSTCKKPWNLGSHVPPFGYCKN